MEIDPALEARKSATFLQQYRRQAHRVLRWDMAFSSYLWYLISHYQFCGSLLVNRLFRVQKHSKKISFWLGWSVFPDQACDRDRNIAD